ncbi:MAG: 50S ribosome-binding GTPase [Planctomycetes bacterium]|nr:50S ribosome-binding GTPase [Planctomycetota bacterium]
MLGDTIVALASAPGSSERAVLRLSGPRARAAAALVFTPALPEVRCQIDGVVRVRGLQFQALALFLRGPRSFTGEDTVELHVLGSPLLVELLIEALCVGGKELGVRVALPGEFTARAVQNGKLDGLGVEGLLVLLHAADRQQAAMGVQWLQGGSGAVVHTVRSALQDTLALLEAGLDFDEREAGAVPTSVWAPQVRRIAAQLAQVLATAPVVATGGEVMLLGCSNAGKSSLCNALAERPEVLVDAAPGTTRDVLRVAIGDDAAVFDAPGDLDQPASEDAMALALRGSLLGGARGVLLVLDASSPRAPTLALAQQAAAGLPVFGLVWTKRDLVHELPSVPAAIAALLPPQAPVFVTSATAGLGIADLRAWLRRTAKASPVAAGAELRRGLADAEAGVLRALQLAEAEQVAPELVAVDLQAALRALDGLVGNHSPEDLLDRIYARFCLGK